MCIGFAQARFPSFLALIDKSIVFLCVKVVRDTITNNLGVGGTQQQQICGPRRSTGFFPGGDGTIPNVRPGLIPGTWIGPTLIFPGVLNPGIPTTLPFPNTLVAGTFPSQVQIIPTGTATNGNGTT